MLGHTSPALTLEYERLFFWSPSGAPHESLARDSCFSGGPDDLTVPLVP